MANARYLNFQKTLWPLFMYGVQLPQGYRATTMTQFTFPHSVPRSSCYSFYQPQKVDKTKCVFLGETDAQYEK